jgi:hypothetical protein
LPHDCRAAGQKSRRDEAAYLGRLTEIDIWMTPTFSAKVVRIGVVGPVAWLDVSESRDFSSP